MSTFSFIKDSKEDAAFRAEVRAWLGENLPEELLGWATRPPPELIKPWHTKLYEKGVRNEAFVEVRRGEIAKRFSVDKEATAFRVELYRGKKFSGMVLIRFLDDADGSTAERPSVSPGHTSLALNR